MFEIIQPKVTRRITFPFPVYEGEDYIYESVFDGYINNEFHDDITDMLRKPVYRYQVVQREELDGWDIDQVVIDLVSVDPPAGIIDLLNQEWSNILENARNVIQKLYDKRKDMDQSHNHDNKGYWESKAWEVSPKTDNTWDTGKEPKTDNTWDTGKEPKKSDSWGIW